MLQTDVLIAILLASIYGLVVGSLPGLSATMATALLVPVTFYLSPIAAVATIIAASAMAIFSGDIPGALLRIPGTPASAAYTDEAYAMTRKGQPEMALGICVWFSALGGIAGTISLMALAPPLAEMALNFSTYEYFWLAFLGLMCATMVARSSPVKAIASMLIGLLVSCIGIENPAGTPRFTFGSTDLLGGIEPIPALVGVFAVSEVMRAMLTSEPPKLPYRRFGSILAGQLALTKKYVAPQVRGNIVGIIIGVLPGAGADMAAWVSYSMSKRFSKTPEKFGTGHPEGSDRGRRQQQRQPRLGLGAVAAVRHSRRHHHRHRHRRALHEGAQSGPDAVHRAGVQHVCALHHLHHRQHHHDPARHHHDPRGQRGAARAARSAVMPVIVLLCAVGAFATGNNLFAVATVAAFGVIGYVMERNGYPVAAMVLGIVMGTMVEQSFVTSLIKSDGSILPFFSRPVAAVLAAMTIAALLWPLGVWTWNLLRRPTAFPAR